MQRRDLIAIVVGYFRRMEASPSVGHMLAKTDEAIHFMIRPDYIHPNSALAAVRKLLLAGLWIMLALAGIAIIWGAFAPIDSAAVAKGSVVLLSSKKTVQHLEGGIIEELLVKEGETVVAGQQLVRLSNTAANASRDIIEGQLYLARATEERLVSERDKKPAIVFDAELLEKSSHDEKLSKILEAQTQLFTSQRDAEEAKLNVLNQRIAQAKEEIEGFKSQKEGAVGQLALLEEEIGTVQKLLDKGYATRPRLLELERNRSELEGSKGQYGAQAAKVQENITETQMEILNQQNEFDSKNAQDLRDAQAQITEQEDKLKTAQDVADRRVITAPVAGIVTGLKFHTTGGVIEPGTAIMDIVPQDDQLIVEAHVKPTDIDVVRPGLPARVVFSTYKTRITPKVPGIVTQVSADKFTDEHSTPPSSYYIVRVEVDKHFLQTMKKPVELYPGMPADILIRTGERSFFSYLFQPISDSMNGAFREK